MSRCDLHLHSKFSDRSEDWIFRRFDFPDSYTDPHELYARAKEAGMDFVTITDHDTIEGCLALSIVFRYFYQRADYDLFPAGPMQNKSPRLGPDRSAA